MNKKESNGNMLGAIVEYKVGAKRGDRILFEFEIPVETIKYWTGNKEDFKTAIINSIVRDVKNDSKLFLEERIKEVEGRLES